MKKMTMPHRSFHGKARQTDRSGTPSFLFSPDACRPNLTFDKIKPPPAKPFKQT